MAKGIQSILLGFRLLQALTDADAPMSLKTLAAVSSMSPSKARMYLISFIETGLIVQNADTGLYTLRSLRHPPGHPARYSVWS